MNEHDFTYALRAVRVVLRPGARFDATAELHRLGAHRVLIITTAGRAPDAAAVAARCGPLVAGVFDDARPHVPATLVDQAMNSIADLAPDALMAIGGGSPIGLAKAAALRTGLPIVAIPTTYSGSEMTQVWGITADGHKTTGRDARVAPRVVIYDPELTLDWSATASAQSGMNALAHAVEAIYAPDANPVATLLAGRAIAILAVALRRIAAQPADPTARSNALFGAHLAGRALDMTQMGLHHRLCHALGGSFDTPHALTHAILLPHVARFNLMNAPAAAAIIGTALEAPDAAAGIEDLATSIGLRSRLRDIGLGISDLDRVALEWNGGIDRPRPVSARDVRAILHAAW